VRRLVLDVGLPLVDVVTAASGTPAAVLSHRRRSPSPSVGSLRAGSRADLLIAGPKFEPLAVMSGGHWVAGAPD